MRHPDFHKPAWEEARISYSIVNSRLDSITAQLSNEWLQDNEGIQFINDMKHIAGYYAVLCVCEFLCGVYDAPVLLDQSSLLVACPATVAFIDVL